MRRNVTNFETWGVAVAAFLMIVVMPALNAFTAVGGLTGSPTGLPGNAANAGQITSIVGTSRQIQLAVKFLF